MPAYIIGSEVISGCGLGLQDLTEAVFEGRSAIRAADRLRRGAVPIPGARGAMLESSLEGVPPEQLLAKVCRRAVADSGLDLSKVAPARRALCVATSHGTNASLIELLWARHEGTRPSNWAELATRETPRIAHRVARQLDVGGTVCTISTACASGTDVLGRSLALIRSGRADLVLVTSVDVVSVISVAGFGVLGSLAARDVMPFDEDRDGMQLGDAVACMVLCSPALATRLGLSPELEVCGYAAANDAHHVTAPDPQGTAVASVVSALFSREKVDPGELGYVNAHGTATRANDSAEAAGLRTALGEHAARVWVSSSKPVTGHTLGSAGVVEALICLAALQRREAPPMPTTGRIDPACHGLRLCGGLLQPFDSPVAISLNAAFGGATSAAAFRRRSIA